MSGEKWVLIVDDAAFMRSMLKKVIAGENGFRVLEAPDGAQALKLYQEYRPGLVLLDISMPGMNGIEVLKELKKRDPMVFVIMCSAIGQESMIREALDSGASDFIVKPFKPEQITAAVRRAFPSEKPAGAEGNK